MSSYRDGGCDLAALYSLGALDEAERWAFREHLLAGCDACGDDLDKFEPVVAALALACEPARPAPGLRARLLAAVADPAPLHGYRSVVDFAGDWEPYKIPGVTARRLHVDATARVAVLVVRAEAGVTYPAHRHAALEEMFMLDGELRFGDRVYGPGDYIRSECGSLHGSSETPGGCMFLLRASLDNELVV